MILNVSGRTDVVAFYTPWFMKRYEEGFLDVKNPFYEKHISRIFFDDVDAIVFCTKNPLPIIRYLDKINKPILFHVTLTPYKKDIEPYVPPKGNIIEGIKKISDKIGSENIYVRYDPIIINDKYSIEYHIKSFNNLCNLLNGYVKHIIVSFVDDYKNVRKNCNALKIKKLNENDYERIGISFYESAKKCNMTIQTCAEEKNLIEYGFIKSDCVNHSLIFKLTGKTNFPVWKERACRCVGMVDIGVYNTCSHFCKYCYANFDEKKVKENMLKHDKNSTMLIGSIKNDDIIKIRRK